MGVTFMHSASERRDRGRAKSAITPCETSIQPHRWSRQTRALLDIGMSNGKMCAGKTFGMIPALRVN